MVDPVMEFQDLWNGSSPGWILLKDPDAPGEYSIVNIVNWVFKLIDDDETQRKVCLRMIEAGCAIVDKLPPGQFKIDSESSSAETLSNNVDAN